MYNSRCKTSIIILYVLFFRHLNVSVSPKTYLIVPLEALLIDLHNNIESNTASRVTYKTLGILCACISVSPRRLYFLTVTYAVMIIREQYKNHCIFCGF